MQQKLHISLLSIAVTIFHFLSHSQEPDSVSQDSVYFRVYTQKDFPELNFKADIDPLVTTEFQRYKVQEEGIPLLDVGNVGHAGYSPIFNGEISNSPFSALYSGFQPYIVKDEDVRYFRNKPPYTSIMYVSGPRKEELIDVEHTRNFGNQLNFSLHFFRQGSIGFYNHSKIKTGLFDAAINYQTRNRRYTILLNYIFNKKIAEENGGYVDFFDIQDPETAGSSILDDAETIIREESANVYQSFGFGNKAESTDQFIAPVLRLDYDLGLTAGSRYYQDNGNSLLGSYLNSDYYQNIYFDSLSTADSITNLDLKNTLKLWMFPGKLQIGISYMNEFVDYNQHNYVDTVYQNNFVGFGVKTHFNAKYNVDLDVTYGLEGYRGGDVYASLDLVGPILDTANPLVFDGRLFYNLSEPHFIQQRYVSNNFIWSNHFTKSNSLGLALSLNFKGYLLGVEGGRLSNYIYFDDESKPEQYKPEIQYFKSRLSKLLNWKNLYLDNRLEYQYFSNTAIIPIPEFMAYESVYFENSFFSKVLDYQIGFDLFYYSSHYGYGYMAPLNQFYNQGQKKVGSYPYIDFFINFKLKKAYFFFKFSHFNKGMAGDDYFQVPGYPVPPRSFKFGVKWVMFD